MKIIKIKKVEFITKQKEKRIATFWTVHLSFISFYLDLKIQLNWKKRLLNFSNSYILIKSLRNSILIKQIIQYANKENKTTDSKSK